MPKGKEGRDRRDRLEAQLRVKDAIINGISDALMLLDAKTYKILEVNQAFLDCYGLSRDQVLGKRCYEVTHHSNKPCHLAHVDCSCPLEEGATEGIVQTEHAHQDSDGNTHYFEINAYPVKDENGEVTRIIHLSRDITERKRLELEVRGKEKLEGIVELAGGASHEINQPLTVIISGLEQLLKKLRQGDPECEIALAILDHARRLSRVSQKLASITRYASKEYVSGKRVFDLDQGNSDDP
ncbi:MAG: PAS domain-containing protein [Desulfobacteraceae bacterium]|jgi:PAS domain S-box-containing protein